MQSRNACLTVWKFVDDPSNVPIDDEVVRYAVWQREKCPETGKHHLQMYAEANKMMTIKQWKAAVGDETAHVEKRRGTADQAIAYCRKDDSRDDPSGPHEFGSRLRQGARRDLEEKEKRIAVTLSAMLEYGSIQAFMDSDEYASHEVFYNMNEELLNKMYAKRRTIAARKRKQDKWQDMPLYSWQKEVVELCLCIVRDDRYMLWLYSPEGNRGKSRVADYLRSHSDAIELGGKADACRFAYNGQSIVIFDISASQQDYVSALYSVAEQLKNGCVFSSKYCSIQKEFDPPHVLFISNSPAPRDAWKENRVIELRVPERDCDRCIKTVF